MRKSRLSHYKQDRLIEHFVSGSTALTAASLCCVNRKTAAFFFLRLREIIALELEAESEAMFCGEIEVDESYFGGKRKGKRGRGAAGKIPVFGFLKRGGKVYTKIIPDASRATLIPIIERKVIPDSIVYSDCWKAYNVLDVSDFTPRENPEAEKQLRIHTLNDTFRTTFVGGKVMLTSGIQAFGAQNIQEIIREVQTFNDFTPDNDPHGEHDFGSFDHAEQKIFWKMDYYDKTMTYGSEDASDPEQTVRVLTVMWAEEY